jgi:hypothetical protein
VRPRITTLLAACLLAIGFGSFLTANSASAQGTPELCGNQGVCLNAWNTGPDVNVYAPNYSNDAFQYYYVGYNTWNIQYLGPGSYYGDCVGDSSNDPYDARAGLYSDCLNGHVAWGANFTIASQGCGANQVAFHNNHWGGWLAPSGPIAGDSFYLNNPHEYCFTPSTFLG